jgi:hypothetical protein
MQAASITEASLLITSHILPPDAARRGNTHAIKKIFLCGHQEISH